MPTASVAVQTYPQYRNLDEAKSLDLLVQKDDTLRRLLFAVQFWGERGMIPLGEYVHWKRDIELALGIEAKPPRLRFPAL